MTTASGALLVKPRPGSSPPQYSPLSTCAWTIAPPGTPYIRLEFTSFATEELYDVLVGGQTGPMCIC